MFKVKFYKGEYRERQRNASRDKAVCYVEHHFNMTANRNTSCVIIGSNASQKTFEFAEDYARLCQETFQTSLAGNKGVVKGGYDGRGNGNVYYATCPSVLLEPLFCGNPRHVELIKSESGQNLLAEVLVKSIKKHFAEGGLIAFSVGHKYKTSKPNDRGASLLGGGSEADYAEKVLLKAANLLITEKEVQIEEDAIPVKFSEEEEDLVELTPALHITEIPTVTKSIPSPEPVQFREKLKRVFLGLTGGTFSLAVLKEWMEFQLSPETAELLKAILPIVLAIAGVGLIVWYVSEKITNWKLVKLQAEINSDKSRHDIEVKK